MICSKCPCWVRRPDHQQPANIILGDCRRHAPQLHEEKGKLRTKWPSTKDTDGCWEPPGENKPEEWTPGNGHQ
jgi:hypothetical protein